MNVKKQYEELYALMSQALEAKPKVQLATLMPDILALMQSKTSGGNGSTFKKDDDGNITYVYCYYHKKWEAVEHIAYGKKTNTATGLNTMCKEGVSNWSRQQRIYNKAKSDLLEQVALGEVDSTNIAGLLDELEQARKEIVPHSNQEHSHDDI